MKARVFVTLKNGVLDPQGKAIGHALNNLGFAAVGEVRKGAAQIAFLLKPTSVQQVSDTSFGGRVMPQKSTDFYPKLLSGMVMYKLD